MKQNEANEDDFVILATGTRSKKLRSLILSVAFLFQLIVLQAQQNIQFILPDNSKTSLYDIHYLNKELWIGGKEGNLYKADSAGAMQQVHYAANKNNILSIDHFSDDKIILTADSGIYFIGDLKNNSWHKSKIEGLQYSGIYNIAIVNHQTAYICGGNSKITKGKIAVPGGFIYKTADGGNTWRRIYSSSGSMVWDIKYNNKNKTLYALTYSVFGSKLLEIQEENNIVFRKKIFSTRKLLHSFDLDENRIILAGGNYFKKNKTGTIYELDSSKTNKYTLENFIWDVKITPTGFLCCSAGYIYVRKEDFFHKVTIGIPSDFYEIINPWDNPEDIVVVGTSGNIVRVKF